MPSGLRFCRNCGYRLGEGSAEYTETVRFQNGQRATPPGNVATAASAAYRTRYELGGGPVAVGPGGQIRRRRKKMSGMSWIFLALIIFFIGAGGFTALFSPLRRGINFEFHPPASPRSYVGVNQFDSTDGGVTFDDVEPPGSPADKAGLVGGDIITIFDGQLVTSDDEMMDLLGKTPIGKTVEVVFVRDGETKTTKLTTISREVFDQLVRAFRSRPEGRGQLGYEPGDAERVDVSETKLHGVRLGKILPSRPADLAGLRDGDVVIEFDRIPIRTPEELRSRVQRALPYSTVNVVVIRGTERLEIPVKMGRQ